MKMQGWLARAEKMGPQAGEGGSGVGAAWQIASVGKLKNAVDRFFLLSACSCQPCPPCVSFPLTLHSARGKHGNTLACRKPCTIYERE